MRFLPTFIGWITLVLSFSGCKESPPCKPALNDSLSFTILGGEENGYAIGDLSKGETGYTFTITSGNEAGLFTVDATTGKLTLSNADSFYADGVMSYKLSVTSDQAECESGLIEVDIIEDNFNTRVAASLDSIKTRYGIQGLAYTVILPSKSIKSGLLGIQSPGEDLSKDDLWHFASNTKMVTAVLIMQLVDESVISLDDKLAKFDFRHPNIDTNYTIRQMLGHNTIFRITQEQVTRFGRIYTEIGLKCLNWITC